MGFEQNYLLYKTSKNCFDGSNTLTFGIDRSMMSNVLLTAFSWNSWISAFSPGITNC